MAVGKVLQLVNGRAQMVSDPAYTTIYDQITTVASPITAGTAVTLPASQTFTGQELQVYLNGQFQEVTLDYTYVGGSAPYSQITFTFDLVANDVIRFRIDRLP